MFQVGLYYWAWVSIIGAFIENRYVGGKGYLEEDHLVPKRGFGVNAIQIVSRPRTSQLL